MRGLARHRAAWALLVPLLLAVLIQALAPNWATLAMAARSDRAMLDRTTLGWATSGWATLGDVALCLAPQPASPDSDAPAGAPKNPLCAICQAFAAVQTALTGGTIQLPGPTALGRRLRRPNLRPAPPRPVSVRPKARAPPLAAASPSEPIIRQSTIC